MKDTLWFVVICLCLVNISCSDDDDDDEKLCNIATDTYTSLNSGTIIYSVTGTGNFTVTSLVYNDTTGEVTVNIPALPYIDTLNVPGGTDVRLAISGKTKNGMLTIKHTFNSITESEENSVDCGNSSN